MNIIVEGIDRVGKSTLAKILSERYNFHVHKHVGIVPIKNIDNLNATDKMLELIEMMKETCSSLIFDRFHLTDFVYGCVERNYNMLDAIERFTMIEDKLDIQSTLLILVKPTSVENSSKEHGKDLTLHSKLFETLFSMSKLKKIALTYNEFDNNNILYNTIYEMIQENA